MQKADVAVVVVHGIGQQQRGETLLEWCEPIIRRADYLSRHSGGSGATLMSADVLTAEATGVRATISLPNGRARSIIFTEANWSSAFLAPRPNEVAGWVMKYSLRAGWRFGRHLLRTALGTWIASSRRLVKPTVVRVPSDDGGTLHVVRHQSYWLLMIESLGFYLSVVLSAFATLIGGISLVLIGWILPILATIIVFLLFILVRAPIVGKWFRPAAGLLVNFIGDATAWTSEPVRAAAILSTVRGAIRRARESAKRVVVVAHSQGAAVSIYAALQGTGAERVDHLVTVGGATSLLSEVKWPTSSPIDFHPVKAWSESTMDWTNIWAGFDPVSAGPIALPRRAAKKAARLRWKEVSRGTKWLSESWLTVAREHFGSETGGLTFWQLYGLILIPKRWHPWRVDRDLRLHPAVELGEAQLEELLPAARQQMNEDHPGSPGPEERRVHNHGSFITDHVSYTQNIAQVIEPIVRHAILEGQLGTSHDSRIVARRHAHSVRLLALARLFAAVLALVLTPVLLAFLSNETISDVATDLSRDSAVLSSMVAAISTAGVWGIVTFSLVALLMYVMLTGLLGAAWRLWLSDFEWALDRQRMAGRVLRTVPFFVLLIATIGVGTYFGLIWAFSALARILNLEYLQFLATEPGFILYLTCLVTLIFIVNSFIGGEFVPIPARRIVLTEPEPTAAANPAEPASPMGSGVVAGGTLSDGEA